MSNPTTLVLSPGVSENASGPVSPSLNGAVRVVESDTPLPPYTEIVPATINYVRKPWPRASSTIDGYARGNANSNVPEVVTVDGSNWLELERILTGGMSIYGSTDARPIGLTPGTVYTYSVEIDNPLGIQVRQSIEWRDAGGAAISSSQSAYVTTESGRLVFTATAPPLTSYAHLLVQTTTGVVGETIRAREWQLEKGSVATPFAYGDMDLVDWEGTPNASRSIRQRTPGIPEWFVEEGTTNLIFNPWLYNDVSNTSGENGAVRTRVGDSKSPTGTAVRVVADGSAAYQAMNWLGSSTALGSGVKTFTGSVSVYGTGTVFLVARAFVNGFSTARDFVVQCDLTAEPKRYSATVTTQAGDTINQVNVYVASKWDGTMATMDCVAFGAQMEEKAYATSPCPELTSGGELKPGYSSVGTLHASPSTRAGAQVSEAVSLNVQEGEIIAWYSPVTLLGTAYPQFIRSGTVDTNLGINRSNTGRYWTFGSAVADVGSEPVSMVSMSWRGDSRTIRVNGREVTTTGNPAIVSAGTINTGPTNQWAGGGDYRAIAVFNRELTDDERERLATWPNPGGFRVRTFEEWELMAMAIRRILRGTVGVPGPSGSGVNSAEKTYIMDTLSDLLSANLGDHADTTFTSLTAGDVPRWDGTKWVNAQAANGLSNVLRAGVSILAPTTALDFAAAFALANAGSGKVTVAPTFGTGANQFAEGNHAHTAYPLGIGRTESGSFSNIPSGTVTIGSTSINLAAGVTFDIIALVIVEAYGVTTVANGRVRCTIDGNTYESGSDLAFEQGVDGPKLVAHSRTIVGAGAAVTISASIRWTSGGSIRPVQCIIIPIALPRS